MKCQCWSMTNGKIWWKRLNMLVRCAPYGNLRQFKIDWACRQPHARIENAIQWFARYIMWEYNSKRNSYCDELSPLFLFIFMSKDPSILFPPTASHSSTMERTTQTEPPRAKKWKQIWLCFLGDDKFRRDRQREATEKSMCPMFHLILITTYFDQIQCHYGRWL